MVWKGRVLGSQMETLTLGQEPSLKEWRVLHQGRGAVRDKEQWKKNSKKQRAEEIGTDLELLCQPTPH